MEIFLMYYSQGKMFLSFHGGEEEEKMFYISWNRFDFSVLAI